VKQYWLVRSRGDREKGRRAGSPQGLKDRTGQDDEREGNKTGNHGFGEVLRKRWHALMADRRAGAEEACA
jgi:hypothetical protein